MERCIVIDVPGLTPKLIGASTPHLRAFAARGRVVPIENIIPSVNCAVQATFLTGTHPSEHGVVGDGWYNHDACDIKYWSQSDKVVQRPQIWETARRLNSDFTCAKLFWFMNMYSTADYTITPQPAFPSDGRIVPSLYTEPSHLRQPLIDEFGQFPIYNWWGPSADIRSSRWISKAAMWLEQRHRPTLSLVFLPHLDYAPHKLGPDPSLIAKPLKEIDDVCGEMISFYESRGVRVIILSEYGISPVSRAVHINRLFRKKGWIAVREELGHEVMHPGGSEVFAVVDMQVAHVHVKNPALLPEVKALLEAEPGVGQVLDEEGKRAHHLDHPRCGELVALAEPDSWFTYYFWLDEARAPDYARTVDIFHKPGYDPVELFLDPEMRLTLLKYGWGLLKDKIGFRTLLEFIPLDASLLRGAHGLLTAPDAGPMLISRQVNLLPASSLHATGVHDVILAHMNLTRPGAKPVMD